MVGGHDEPIRGEHQRQGEFGDGVSVASRRAQHRYPGAGRRVDVDVVGVASTRSDQLQREVEDRPLHRVGLDDQDVGAFLDQTRCELLTIQDADRDVFDPRVVHDVDQRVERLPTLAPERRGDKRLVSFGHRVILTAWLTRTSGWPRADPGAERPATLVGGRPNGEVVARRARSLTSERAHSLRTRQRTRRRDHDRPARGPKRG